MNGTQEAAEGQAPEQLHRVETIAKRFDVGRTSVYALIRSSNPTINPEVVDLLTRFGFDGNPVDGHGRTATPAEMAMIHGAKWADLEAAREMLSRAVDLLAERIKPQRSSSRSALRGCRPDPPSRMR